MKYQNQLQHNVAQTLQQQHQHQHQHQQHQQQPHQQQLQLIQQQPLQHILPPTAHSVNMVSHSIKFNFSLRFFFCQFFICSILITVEWK